MRPIESGVYPLPQAKVSPRYKNKLMKLNRWHGLHLLPTANTHSLDDCRKKKPLFFKTNRRLFVRSLPQLLPCFLCSVQHSNLISRNFHYDAMQQYRLSNFSGVFCLNCSFVIDATLKHLNAVYLQ